MRLTQIFVDGLDDLGSFASAINNWPALIVSGAISLSVAVATYVFAPWVYVLGAILAASGAALWVMALLWLALPVVRRRTLGCYCVTLLASCAGVVLALQPQTSVAQQGAMWVAAAAALISAFLAHELTREFSLQARSLSVYKFK